MRRPISIVLIAAFDGVCALSAALAIEQLGWLASALQAVIFGALAIGLWHVKRWAWFAELAISAGLTLLLLILLTLATAFPLAEGFGPDERNQLVAFMGALMLTNVGIVGCLLSPTARKSFRKSSPQ